MSVSPWKVLSVALVLTVAACSSASTTPDAAPRRVVVRPSRESPGQPLRASTTTTTIDLEGVLRVQRAAWVIAVGRDQAAARARAEALRRAPSVRIGTAIHVQVHSEAWWHAISICEQGGRNHPFFGYFSIMDGSAGGLPWGTQVQMAQRIIDRAGDYAWADKCVHDAYRAAPGG